MLRMITRCTRAMSFPADIVKVRAAIIQANHLRVNITNKLNIHSNSASKGGIEPDAQNGKRKRDSLKSS